MLRKKDVAKEFEKIMLLYTAFKTVEDRNLFLEKKIKSEQKVELSSPKILGNDSTEKYIINGISDLKIKKIVFFLLKEMEKYGFKGESSVPSNRKLAMESGHHINRYELLSKIKLYAHTINCVFSCIDICKSENIPDPLKDIAIIVAILHDFGKSPLIYKRYSTNKSNTHNEVSAFYAKKELRRFLNKEIKQETINQIYIALYNHHAVARKLNENILKEHQNNYLIKILNKSDFLAREKEEIFAENYLLERGVK